MTTKREYDLAVAFYARLPEWTAAAIVLNIGIILMMEPLLMKQSTNLSVLLVYADQKAWAIMATAIGAVRFIVLAINGSWRKSPHLRAICAFLSCFVWTQITLSLNASELLSIGLGVYPVLLVVDLINILRSSQDARTVDDAFKGRGLDAGQRPPE